MSFITTTLTSLLAVSAVQAFPFTRRASAGLNTAAQAAGLEYFGSATDNYELSDTDYETGLNNTADFGQITPGNSMKWDTIEASQNTFSYTKGDVIADLAEENGQKLRCHNLVWYNQLPDWVSSGSFDNDTLVEILKNHITNEVTHYKGRCLHWDVVNEALDSDGSYRSFVFYDTIGEAYIPIAFAAAAAADPDAKLYYNDYNIEYSGDKATAAKQLVEMVQSYGVKIDGVGLQSHFTVGNTPSQDSMVSTMESYTALGVEVAITELDIRTTTPATDSALEQQSTDYATVVNACLAVDGCVGITIWDYTDKYSWVPDTFSGYGAALPWDEDLEKKPAYTGILNALQSGSSNTSTASTTVAAAAVTTNATATQATTTPVAQVTSSATVVTSVAQVATSSAAEVATTKTTTSAAVATSSSASGSTSTVAKYGQCGGKSYEGSTTCESGSTCTAYNDWYSQCV